MQQNGLEKGNLTLRIAHLSSLGTGDGGEMHVRGIIGAWRKLGHQVLEVNVLDRQALRLSKNRRLARHLPRVVKELFIFYTNLQYYLLAKNILKPPLGFIYARDELFHIYPLRLAEKFNVPLILEVNSPLWEAKREGKLTWFGESLANLYFKKKVHKAKLIVLVSSILADVLKADYKVNREKIVVIPNGVDLCRFEKTNREEVRSRYNMGKSFVIGFIGSFKIWHGVERLLPILKSLLAREIDARLVLIGSGDTENKLDMLAHKLGIEDRVIMTGQVKSFEIPNLLSAIDVAVAPYYRYEPFYFSPLKFFEYIASGRPVIASSLGQIKEIMTDGREGFLVDPEDDSCFIDRLIRLALDPQLRKAQGDAARELAKRYTWSEAGSRLLNAIKVRGILKDV